jgi:hypothetical protein
VTLDLFTVSVMTALVVNVSGILFIAETLLRRDDGAGRVWSVAYLFGMLTTVAYAAWASGEGGVTAVAVGNALFVASAGCMWLGARRYSQRSMTLGLVAVPVATFVTGAAVFVDWQAAEDWAGIVVMYVCVTVLTALGAIECFRRPMGRTRISWVLGLIMCAVSAFYVGRAVVFLLTGPHSALFTTYFGTIAADMVTATLVIVGVVVTSVLRAMNVEPRAFAWVTPNGIASDGILLNPTFVAAVQDLAERAGRRKELLALVSVRIDDLGQIATAFGADMADSITVTWRAGVRRFAPSDAIVGEDGARGMLVCFLPSTAAEARRHAGMIYRGLFDDLGEITKAVIPVVGIGIALSETFGHDPLTLIANAQRTAHKAAVSTDSSVLFSGVDLVSHD